MAQRDFFGLLPGAPALSRAAAAPGNALLAGLQSIRNYPQRRREAQLERRRREAELQQEREEAMARSTAIRILHAAWMRERARAVPFIGGIGWVRCESCGGYKSEWRMYPCFHVVCPRCRPEPPSTRCEVCHKETEDEERLPVHSLMSRTPKLQHWLLTAFQRELSDRPVVAPPGPLLLETDCPEGFVENVELVPCYHATCGHCLALQQGRYVICPICNTVPSRIRRFPALRAIPDEAPVAAAGEEVCFICRASEPSIRNGCGHGFCLRCLKGCERGTARESPFCPECHRPLRYLRRDGPPEDAPLGHLPLFLPGESDGSPSIEFDDRSEDERLPALPRVQYPRVQQLPLPPNWLD